jgi:hypothetical protein
MRETAHVSNKPEINEMMWGARALKHVPVLFPIWANDIASTTSMRSTPDAA